MAQKIQLPTTNEMKEIIATASAGKMGLLLTPLVWTSHQKYHGQKSHAGVFTAPGFLDR